MSYEIDCVVVGAGVVGLAVARALQLSGREVFLIERERSFGMATSSRNSEVIHAGIYYSPGSLKAQLCVRGKGLLYDYCQQRGVPHHRTGKLIVACEESELPILEQYKRTAEENGVMDLRLVETAELSAMEPQVRALRGLYSPSTGILDSHAYMQALLHDFEIDGGTWLRQTAVLGGRVLNAGIELDLQDGEGTRLYARSVVNAAGLHAPALAKSIEGMPAVYIPKAHYAIGHYYVLSGRSPFQHLVYPIAQAGGLGVHVTLDMSGAARFGPDVSWRETIDYQFDDTRRDAFVQAIRRYHPAIRHEDLRPAYTGIRPKISGPDEPSRDFIIQSEEEHGVPGLVHLFGIESPGLTSSLAIAEAVQAVLGCCCADRQ